MDRRVSDVRFRASAGRVVTVGGAHALAAVLCIVLVIGSLWPEGLTVSAAAESERVYVGQQAGLSASIPSTWKVDRTGTFDYAGADGFIGSGLLPQQTLFDACTFIAEQFDAGIAPLLATWSHQTACTVPVEAAAREGRVLVVPLPTTISQFDTDYHFAFVLADRAHFDGIVATVSFDPSRVSPEAFVSSVVDLVEAFSWWSDKVDWPTLRQSMLSWARDVPDLASSQQVLQRMVNTLRLVGDNHSFLLSPEQADSYGQSDGFGLEVGDRWVLAVYPDSPAARAGIRERDRILAVDGEPPANTYGADPALVWGTSVTLTISRPGIASDMSIPLVADTYTGYRPPEAAFDGSLGYIDLPGFVVMDRAKDYASAANTQIGIIDRRGACGWIVDLRLDHGGDYRPMVSAVGSILGDDTFVGWLAPEGPKTWVSYDNGVIRDNGYVVSDLLSSTERHQLTAPMPPVAVLLGPGTTSSGEVTALAFLGRPDARSFGTKTGGYTTANTTLQLFDGSTLVLAVAAMMDRSGTTYLEGILPDQIVLGTWNTFGAKDDPVIQAASEWLLSQDACQSATGTPAASPVALP